MCSYQGCSRFILFASCLVSTWTCPTDGKAGEVKVVEVSIVEFRDLHDPEYRVGDLTRAAVKERRITPYALIQFQGGDDYVTTRTHTDYAKDKGKFGETLLLQIPDAGDRQLVVEVRDDVGLRSVVRGHPLFGNCTINLKDDRSRMLYPQCELERDGKSHGSLRLQVNVSQRYSRKALLGKAARFNVPVIKNYVNHWGLILEDADGEESVYEKRAIGNNSEFGVVGPRGLIAHNVPDQTWESFKQTVAEKVISDDEFKRRIVTAENFDKECMGYALRSPEEIDDFSVSWVSAHSDHKWELNPHKFTKDLFKFVTGGHDIAKFLKKPGKHDEL